MGAEGLALSLGGRTGSLPEDGSELQLLSPSESPAIERECDREALLPCFSRPHTGISSFCSSTHGIF
jgi:hypothetical protein